MAEPGYQFGLTQGRDILEGSAAARGGLYSGRALRELTQYGNDYATTRYGDAWNREQANFGNRWGRLAGLAGVGQSATQQVSAAVGGDLTITSRQDTETHTSWQQNRGGSVTIGPAPSGNLNTAGSRIDSRYASVAEVAGLKAGDGGFDVTVGGNLSLTGGVIASTDHALEAGHNRLAVEGKATTHDIANLAQYQASGHGVNIGAGYSPQGAWVPGGTGVGISSDDDQLTSLTRAGISGGAGDATVRSVDEHQPLAKIFDAQRVQDEINAQVQITQTFSTLAPRAVASYADGQIKAINEQLQQ
jgi:filamentous hemagglutinin